MTRALASPLAPTRPRSWAPTPPPPAGAGRKNEPTKRTTAGPAAGCFPRARGFDRAKVNADPREAAEHTRYCFPPALFGLDVLIDRDGRPWLLECQRNPAMTGNPLTNRINAGLFAAAFRMSVFYLLDDLDDDPASLAEEARRAALEEAKEMTVAPGFERVTSS